MAACALISQMEALRLLVAAALRGNLDLCRVGIITCKTHTNILENVEKPCCMLPGGGQGPLPLWGPCATSCCQVCVCQDSVQELYVALAGCDRADI